MTNPHNLRINHLLDSLPVDVYQRLFNQLEGVPMSFGEVLYEPGDKLRYAYFPTTCTVSLFYNMENGTSPEIVEIGNEGMINIALFMGGGAMPNRVVVLSEGYAYRLSRELFMQEFDHFGVFYHLLLRYTQSLVTQMAQTAVCNRHHAVDRQLCRRLLLSLDRLSSNELTLSQELIANVLGVRLEDVIEAVIQLQQAGLIEYSQGQFKVLDRPGLEARVCECYPVVKAESLRLRTSSWRVPLSSRPEVSLFPVRSFPH